MHSQLPRFLVFISNFPLFHWLALWSLKHSGTTVPACDTRLSAAAHDGHQAYCGGSIVGKASLIAPEISPTLYFLQGKAKVRNFLSFLLSLNYEPTAFENAAISELWNKLLKQRLSPYVLAEFRDVRSMRPLENRPEKVPRRLKLDGENVWNHQ